MLKTIELKKYGRVLEKEPFFIPDNLEFSFTGDYDLSFAKITLQNGAIKGSYPIALPFKVDQKFLFPGRLKIGVNIPTGTTMHHIDVLPLEIIGTESGNLEAFDLLSQLEREVEAMKNVKAEKNEVKALFDKVNEIIIKQNEIVETIKVLKKGE